jgi:hypothetical protein
MRIPQTNMSETEAQRSAPRPGRLSKKWPPPGTSQPKATAGTHAVIGAMGGFCSFSLAMGFNI